MDKIKMLTFLLFSILLCQNTEAQEALKGLQIVGEEDLKSEIGFEKDLTKLPFFDIEGKPITQEEAQSLLDSFKFFPQFYMNKNKKIEAIVLGDMKADMPSARAKMMSVSLLKANKAKKSFKISDFEALDMDGNEVSLSALKGKVVVMNFWFTRCKPCVDEMPELNKIVEKYSDNDSVVFLALSWNKKDAIRSFLNKYSFLYRIIPESGKMIKDYGIGSFPTNLVLNQKGEVAYKAIGLGPNTIPELENTLTSLLQ